MVFIAAAVAGEVLCRAIKKKVLGRIGSPSQICDAGSVLRWRWGGYCERAGLELEIRTNKTTATVAVNTFLDLLL